MISRYSGSVHMHSTPLTHPSSPSLFFILGPTGSGKSSLAISLAEAMGDCEIVSADAYQIYKHLPLLTAAPSAEERQRVPHHLIHELELWESHDASVHARMAMRAIEDIQRRGKRVIVTGGSGLYVKFISHGISEAPPSDLSLRAQLEELSHDELITRFKEIDPEGLAITPVENKRYLVRNLEIVLLSGNPLSHWRRNWDHQVPLGPGWVLDWDVPLLDSRIAQRAQEMLQSGVCEELQAAKTSLLACGKELSDTAKKTLGMLEVESCIRGEISSEECVKQLALRTRQYAKRQRTWLRREGWLQPIDAVSTPERSIIESILGKI